MKFIDICFPDKNEEIFIEIAKKIKTDGLVFVYDKEKNIRKLEQDNDNKFKFFIYQFCIRKDIFLFSENHKKKLCFIDESFKLPERLSQTFVKKIKKNNITLGISPWLLKNNAFEISKFILFFRLCKKYKLDLFICSLAKNPYELKEKRQLYSFLKLFLKENNYSKKSIYCLDTYLRTKEVFE